MLRNEPNPHIRVDDYSKDVDFAHQMFLDDGYTDYNEREKMKWLRFATRDSVVSTFMLSLGEDVCEWTVVKRYVPDSDLEAVTVRRIHVPGLTAFLATAPKMP